MRTRPGLSWLLLLTACGGDTSNPVRPCDRLGLLCADDDRVLGLGLNDAHGVTADLDGDGALDLITAAGPSGLSIAWGRASLRDYHLFPGPVPDAKIGDLDRDGHLDLAFLTSQPAALHILTGTGTRTLEDGPIHTLAGQPQSLWLGHLDADDTLDAAVASSGEGTLTILTDGLTRARPIALGRDLVAVDAADLNGDDRLDLVALDQGDAAFHLVLATGDTFATPRRIATGLAPRYLQLLDHDGDGHVDVLTHGKGPEIWSHQGDGAGNFSPARALLIQDQASPGFGAFRDDQDRRWLLTIDYANVTATQLDADDHQVGRVRGGGSLGFTGLDMDASAVLAHGDWYGRSFSLEPAHIFSERWHGGTYPDRDLRFADLDQDGAPELIALAQFVLVVYKQLPDGSWSELTRLELDESTHEMVVTDLTGDGLPDLALLEGTATLRAATGTGDGNFTLLESTTVLPTDNVNLYPLSLPGGGPAGLLVTYTVDETFSLYTYQLDGGTLLPTHTDSLADDPMHLALADLDHDGGDDLVALTRADDDTVSLVILPGTIDGFAAPRSRALSPLIPDLSTSTRLVLGDLDLDGTIDALLLDAPRIARLLDIAADAPPPPQRFDDTLTTHARTGVIADADADGRPDLACCSSDGLTIVLATADDRWAAQPAFDSYFDICAIHVDPDTQRATAALGDSGAVTILTPDLAPAFVPIQSFSGGPAPFTSLTTGDLDADGNLDIVLAASANSDTPTGSNAVLWGSPDGRPRAATWSDGHLFGGALPLLAPLDDRPGDELVLAWYDGTVEILTATDHALEPGTVAHTDLYGPAAVAVQARADGPADVLLLARPGDPWTAVALPRASDGSFLPGDPVPLWTGPAGDATPFLTLADLDTDGFADIVVSAGTNNPIVLLWGDEQRAPTPVTLPAPAGTYNITAADMDGDGRPELILGTIDGVLGLTFRDREPQPLVTYLKSTSQDGLLVADLESDGHADLLRRDGESLNVTLRAPARADALLQLSVPPTWQQLHAADLDSDGILDLLGLQNGDLVTRLSAPQ